MKTCEGCRLYVICEIAAAMDGSSYALNQLVEDDLGIELMHMVADKCPLFDAAVIKEDEG